MYLIMGKYQGTTEEVDHIDPTETDTPEQDAEYLVNEYRLAFGPEWTLWVKKPQ